MRIVDHCQRAKDIINHDDIIIKTTILEKILCFSASVSKLNNMSTPMQRKWQTIKDFIYVAT